MLEEVLDFVGVLVLEGFLLLDDLREELDLVVELERGVVLVRILLELLRELDDVEDDEDNGLIDDELGAEEVPVSDDTTEDEEVDSVVDDSIGELGSGSSTKTAESMA